MLQTHHLYSIYDITYNCLDILVQYVKNKFVLCSSHLCIRQGEEAWHPINISITLGGIAWLVFSIEESS